MTWQRAVCGRALKTKDGTCQNGISWHGGPEWHLPACRVHMTSEEHRAVRVAEQHWRRAIEQTPCPPPACWSWTNSVVASQTVIFTTWSARLRHQQRTWGALHSDEWRVIRLEAFEHWHLGRCAVCGLRQRLIVDHCHRSGLVRGMLCYSCNNRDGSQTYRQHTAANVVGCRILYRDQYGGTPLYPTLPSKTETHRRLDAIDMARGTWTPGADEIAARIAEVDAQQIHGQTSVPVTGYGKEDR